MDTELLRKQLIILMNEYITGRTKLQELYNFAFDIIDYFTETDKELLPPYKENEKEFWYAIWQIQHLADLEHEKEGIAIKELSKALDFLEGKKKYQKILSEEGLYKLKRI